MVLKLTELKMISKRAGLEDQQFNLEYTEFKMALNQLANYQHIDDTQVHEIERHYQRIKCSSV